MKDLTKLNRRRWAVQLALTTGLALLFITALLCGLLGVTPARANPGTLYVDGASGSDDSDCRNPAAPCATISYALPQAGNGDEIRVAEGTYTETLDIHRAVTLKGGYEATGWTRDIAAHPTIMDADGADSPVFTIFPESNVIVEGFTVQGANNISDWGGGFVIDGATVVISDTVVRDNSTGGCGGGAFIGNSVGAENVKVSLINSTFVGNVADSCAAGLMVGGGDPFQVTIENTVFTGNAGSDVLNLEQTFEMVGGQVSSNTVTAGGNAIEISGSGTISGTGIMSNTSRAMGIGPDSVVSAHNLTVRGNTGGGIENGGVLTLTNSIIENNSGGWAVVASGWESETNLMMDGCTIRGNDTDSTVVIATGYAEIHDTKIVDNETAGPAGVAIVMIGEAGFTPTVEMVNVLVADNETQGAPIVYNVAGFAMLMNVTLAGNVNGDAPIIWADGVMTMTNTILWGNTTSAENMITGPGILSASYSDIEGGWTGGAGNIDADPKFVGPANGDYRLGVGSPCIDKGTSAGAPTHDIEGTPRDAAPDMGPYEWTGFRIFLPLTLRNFGP